MSATVLIVDDERMLVETIQYNLEKAGFATLTAHDGSAALELARSAKPQLVILDLMLPRVSGWEVCRSLRTDPQYRTDAPILMLTARGEESDRVVGLEMGADDYMIKPFGMRELVARVRALLRRATSEPESLQGLLDAGGVRLDLERREVRVQMDDGPPRELRLSLKEFDLLRALMSQNGKAVTRRQLIDRVWGDDFSGDQRTLDVHIRWLREKLEPLPSQPRHIVTVRGVGYKFKA